MVVDPTSSLLRVAPAMTRPRIFSLRLILATCVLLIGRPAPGADAPAHDLSGTWTWKWQDAEGETHEHVLEVEGKAPKLAARERFDGLPPVRAEDILVDGTSVRLTVRRGDRISRYVGEFADRDTINGKVTVTVDGQPQQYGWTARRQKPSP